MSVNKKLLSFELMEAQVILELPDRELMHVRHNKVVNNHNITAKTSASSDCSHSGIGGNGGNASVSSSATASGGVLSVLSLAIAANAASPATGGAGGAGVFAPMNSCNAAAGTSITT